MPKNLDAVAAFGHRGVSRMQEVDLGGELFDALRCGTQPSRRRPLKVSILKQLQSSPSATGRFLCCREWTLGSVVERLWSKELCAAVVLPDCLIRRVKARPLSLRWQKRILQLCCPLWNRKKFYNWWISQVYLRIWTILGEFWVHEDWVMYPASIMPRKLICIARTSCKCRCWFSHRNAMHKTLYMRALLNQ